MTDELQFSFLDDFVFKYIFGQERNKRLLISLLNALLHREGKARIVDIDILNPFNLKDIDEAKVSIVDVKARDSAGHRYLIEVQVKRDEGIVPRTLYYLARLFTEQLGEGGDYMSLAPATSIALCDFTVFSGNSRVQTVFRMCDIESGSELRHGDPEVTPLELHFIQLKKIGDLATTKLRTRFEKWLHILRFGRRYPDPAQLPAPLSADEEICMAVKELQRMNADAELRQVLEQRAKEAHAVASLRGEGFRAGKAEGLAEGKAEERNALAAKMRQKGYTREQILDLTGVDIDRLPGLTR